ncbi:calcium-dependent phosphotriesterase [Xylariaceae sp. AK1471]|nr:calcium-dependent phosphotriesterase [Xylariaceae sp. AK1471]
MFHSSFGSVIGDTCTFSHLGFPNSSGNPFFYKGCAYISDKDELYATSDLLPPTTSSTLPAILISKVLMHRHSQVIIADWTKLRPPPNMPMPSGIIPYKNGVLYCSQGTLEPNSGGLFYMAQGKRPVPVVTNYFGKPFNSIQSVVEDKDGALWFTDSCAGNELEIRPAPQLPSHVYWFHPTTGELRVVADDLKRPSGIALDPGENILYVTDTDAARPGNTTMATSSATIYAYDIVRRPGASPFLANKHVFAFAFSGVPAAVICDPAGNVYAACVDGVEVWNSGGTALGVIEIPRGCSSLCFGRTGEIFVCGGQSLWRVQLEGVIFRDP